MFSIGVRKFLFWTTLLTIVGSVGMILYPATCADVDPRVYVGLFALCPLAALIDAVVSIVNRRAREFVFLDQRPTGPSDGLIGRVERYEVREVTGSDAVALGRSRLVLPGIALLAYGALLALSSSPPPCP